MSDPRRATEPFVPLPMMRFVAPFFALLAAMAVLGSLAALLFLPDALAEFEHEPEDAYLLVFWAVLLSLLGLFWVSVAVRSYRCSAGGLGPRGRVVATLVALAGGLIAGIGFFDPFDAPLLVGLGLLCAASAGVFVWDSRAQRHVPEHDAADVRPGT